MNKKERLNLIIDIINTQEVSTQDELAGILNDKGLDVTQATVSRDINELGLKKTSGQKHKFKYYLPKQSNSNDLDDLLGILSKLVQSVDYANNLVVVKTLSGNANSVAALLDNLSLVNSLGSIAGDDTIMIIARDENSALNIVSVIKEYL